MDINTIKVSITEMPIEEAMKVILNIRNARRNWTRPVKKGKARSTSKRTRKPVDPAVKVFKEKTKGMSQAELLRKLKAFKEGGNVDGQS